MRDIVREGPRGPNLCSMKVRRPHHLPSAATFNAHLNRSLLSLLRGG